MARCLQYRRANPPAKNHQCKTTEHEGLDDSLPSLDFFHVGFGVFGKVNWGLHRIPLLLRRRARRLRCGTFDYSLTMFSGGRHFTDTNEELG